MFARLKETIRIVTYRYPNTQGPDAVIVNKTKDTPSRFSKGVAFVIEGMFFVYVVGFVAGRIGDTLARFHPTKVVSTATIVGVLGALLFWLSHNLFLDIQIRLKKNLNLAERLAPYFGHKLDETYRIIKG